jgi:sugar O-acyltransferase (sialic acid O-acetyltransferase NeuD family)
MEKIIIIGASGHGTVITDILEENGQYEVFGFIDSFKEIGSRVFGYPILGNENHIPYLMEKEGITKGIIAIGDNWERKKMFKKIKDMAPAFDFISAIHPSASVSKYATIGKGTVVMAGTVINANAQTGDFSIVNSKASFGHDSILGKFSSLSPGVIVGGNVAIGKFSAISIGVIIVNNITIGKHTVIGAGAVVTRDMGNFQVAHGIPAKFIKKRNKGDLYLNKNEIS